MQFCKGETCNFALVASNVSEVLTSPGYPDSYADNLNCVWNITAQPGYFVYLVFNDFRLEPMFDRVSVSNYFLTF